MLSYQSKLTNQITKIKDLAKIYTEHEEEAVKYQALYSKLIDNIQSSGLSSEDTDSMYAGLYRHLKEVKQRIIAKYKFDKRDVDLYLEQYKKNNRAILPILKDIPLYNENAPPASTVCTFNCIAIQDLSKVDFDMLSYTEQDLSTFAFNILRHLNIHPELNIKDNTLKQLMYEITYNYNIVPYHHYTHAFSVFQMFFSLIQRTNLKEYLGNVEVFASLIGSLAHDMNHRGVNNGWHTKKKSYESQIYSDTSVLENLHIAHFFTLMKKKPEVSILDSISDPNAKMSFKRLLVKNVLATDMAKHNRQVAKLGKRARATIDNQARIKAGEELEAPISDLVLLADRAEDRRFVSNVIVHACDIGNCALPFEKYMSWAFLIVQEFDNQTCKEARHGLDVTGFLKFKDKKGFLDGQSFFVNNLVYPLWTNIKVLLTGAEEFTQGIEQNIKKLKEEKDKIPESS